MWAPIRVGRDLEEFKFRDPTAGTRTHGGLLVLEYDAGEVCGGPTRWAPVCVGAPGPCLCCACL